MPRKKPNKEKKEEMLQVKVLLEKDLAKKFCDIKNEHGFQNNSEAIRFCISQEFKRLQETKKLKRRQAEKGANPRHI